MNQKEKGKGKWIKLRNPYYLKCSLCGHLDYQMDENYIPNFCHCCMEEMDTENFISWREYYASH